MMFKCRESHQSHKTYTENVNSWESKVQSRKAFPKRFFSIKHLFQSLVSTERLLLTQAGFQRTSMSLTKLVYPSLLQSKVKKAHNQQKSRQIGEKVRSISFWFHKCKAQVLGIGFGCRTREAQCQGLAATHFPETTLWMNWEFYFSASFLSFLFLITLVINSVSRKNISILMLRSCLHWSLVLLHVDTVLRTDWHWGIAQTSSRGETPLTQSMRGSSIICVYLETSY